MSFLTFFLSLQVLSYKSQKTFLKTLPSCKVVPCNGKLEGLEKGLGLRHLAQGKTGQTYGVEGVYTLVP